LAIIRQGAAHFDKYLLDADWSINNGNWMWLSASAFFHQYHRVYRSDPGFGRPAMNARIRAFVDILV
jgi:deoxyribodipyrimidine photolyase